MGASTTYKKSVRWAGKHSNRGSESGYTKTPIARMEGTHENMGATLRKGAKSAEGKSKTFAGPKQRKPSASGY